MSLQKKGRLSRTIRAMASEKAGALLFFGAGSPTIMGGLLKDLTGEADALTLWELRGLWTGGFLVAGSALRGLNDLLPGEKRLSSFSRLAFGASAAALAVAFFPASSLGLSLAKGSLLAALYALGDYIGSGPIPWPEGPRIQKEEKSASKAKLE